MHARADCGYTMAVAIEDSLYSTHLESEEGNKATCTTTTRAMNEKRLSAWIFGRFLCIIRCAPLS
jgi:hypothetical protein